MLERLVMAMTLALLAASITQPGSASVLASGVAVLAVGMLLAARYSGGGFRSRVVTIGHRARQHRQSLSGMPAPRHPATPGRTRSRAPSRGLAAA
ncbi:MAG: hypothetical protein JWP19_1259 [Rhodoglobus sp.]|nr:hypothetical protein [Rhodoglobus sp.]